MTDDGPTTIEPGPAELPTGAVPAAMARCAARVAKLLVRRQLHLHHERVGERVHLPDGRSFEVYRHTSSDAAGDAPAQTLAVWFHLRGVPGGARLRRYLFERESILNTVLYAGFEGYHVKLWMVDPATADYAGLYEWRGREAARRYGDYITAVLRPLSRRGSVGYELLEDVALDRYLASLPPDRPGGSAPSRSAADPILNPPSRRAGR